MTALPSSVRTGASARTPKAGRVTSPRPGRAVAVLTTALAAVTVLAQISYPLLEGQTLRRVTIAVVVLFCATSLAHAAGYLGAAAAGRVLAVAGGIGLAAEAVGVRTGFPFGSYSYTGTLGPQVLGVPLVIPLAWAMMAYPALLLGRTLARRTFVVALIGGVALAAWDLFLDPQMVGDGHWTFSSPEPSLPGVPGIPLTNYAGWLLVSVLVVGALHVVLPDTSALPRRDLAIPTALIVWTWLGSTLANVAFFDRPAVALWGLLGMGLTVVPYLLALRHAGPVRTQVVP
jgi:putative membrane protein